MTIKHTILTKDGTYQEIDLTPIKAIRQKCMECSGWNNAEIKKCNIKDCALFPFRMGKTGIKRNFTKEQREQMAKRLLEARKVQ